MWVPWRAGGVEQQAAANRARNRAVRGQVSHSAAIVQARKAHRKKALKALKAGKMTPKEYQKELKRIG